MTHPSINSLLPSITMSQNGYLDYGSTESIISLWQIQNPIFNGIIIAILTTILSYQAYALGVHPNLTFPATQPLTETCVANDVAVASGEEALANFITCTSSSAAMPMSKGGVNLGGLAMRVMSNISVQVQVLANGERLEMFMKRSLGVKGERSLLRGRRRMICYAREGERGRILRRRREGKDIT